MRIDTSQMTPEQLKEVKKELIKERDAILRDLHGKYQEVIDLLASIEGTSYRRVQINLLISAELEMEKNKIRDRYDPVIVWMNIRINPKGVKENKFCEKGTLLDSLNPTEGETTPVAP